MDPLENWRTQIRKGYLELCLLRLIKARGRLYGLEILDFLEEHALSVKEGTLYPMLSRMTADHILSAAWETQNLKGHPRKFYSLTNQGHLLLEGMELEFERLYGIFGKVGEIKAGNKEKDNVDRPET